MNDRVAQVVKTSPGQNTALDELTISPAQEQPQLESASFNFPVETAAVAETAQRGPAASAEIEESYGDLKCPREQAARVARARAAHEPGLSDRTYVPTVLDRLINALAKLLQRLDRALFKRLSKKGRRTKEEEAEDELVMPQMSRLLARKALQTKKTKKRRWPLR